MNFISREAPHKQNFYNFFFKNNILYKLRSAMSNLVPRVSHLNAWGERGETLVGSGHVSPRIWEMTIIIYPTKEGAA